MAANVDCSTDGGLRGASGAGELHFVVERLFGVAGGFGGAGDGVDGFQGRHGVTTFGLRGVFDIVWVEAVVGRSGWVERFARPAVSNSAISTSVTEPDVSSTRVGANSIEYPVVVVAMPPRYPEFGILQKHSSRR